MNTRNMTPTFDRVLVEKLLEEVTDSGIILSTNSVVNRANEDEGRSKDELTEDNTVRVKILALGPLCTTPKKAIGTTVLVGKYAGVELKKDSGVIVLNEKDILVTVA